MHSHSANTEEQPKLAAETTISSLDRVNAALAEASADPDAESDFDGIVENEFAVPAGIKASIGGQVVIDTTAKEDLSAFDPSNFIASAQTIVAAMPAKKVDYISLRKPSSTEYVRVTADKAYRMSPVYLLALRKELKTVHYLIMGKCVGEVLSAVGNKVVKTYSIVLAINNSGNPFLWYTREGAEDEWSESAVILQAQAVDDWLRVESAGTHYVGIRPQDKLNEPKWPTESFPQLLKLAFGNRIVSSVDHVAVKFILGITS
jgi:hypothetical protein